MKNIKNIILLMTFILITLHTTAQTWLWSKQAGGANSDFVLDMCIDRNANIYIAGEMQSPNFICGIDTLHCKGFDDCFIVSYDNNGNFRWAKNFGGNNSFPHGEGVNAIAYDSSTNTICAAGMFYGTCILGNDTLTGNEYPFLAKFDLNGNCIWAKKAGAEGGASCMAINSNGEIFINCNNSSNSTFDTISVPAGSIIAKYDSSGNCLWAKKKFNTNGTSDGYDAYFMALKTKGNDLFGIGLCTVSSITVDAITANSNFTNSQYIIARFDSIGTAKWINPCAGQDITRSGGWDIIVDDNSNSYVTGSFSDSAIFENDTITSNNNKELFFAKYNSSGHPIWIKQTNSSNRANGAGLALNRDGIYLTGNFIGTASFGNFTISSSTFADMFIGKYDTSGTCVGVRHVANTAGGSINVDSSSSIYVSGGLYSTATFDSNPSLTSFGMNNIFIAKSSAITGIEEEGRFASDQLIIYANPTQGTCNVTIPDEFRNTKNLTLQIFDINGKMLQQVPVQMSSDKVRLNLEEEAKGIYNVVLSNGKKSYNGKIVFE